MKASEKIIFFDGYCVLCNYWVNSLLRILRKRSDQFSRHPFRFASLQGKTATEILAKMGRTDLQAPPLKSIVLFDGKNFLIESDAILNLSSSLGFPWTALSALRVIPSFIRDSLYRTIATHRYQWFGKNSACRLPTPDEKEWLLD